MHSNAFKLYEKLLRTSKKSRNYFPRDTSSHVCFANLSFDLSFLPENDMSEGDITIRLFPDAFFVLEYPERKEQRGENSIWAR